MKVGLDQYALYPFPSLKGLQVLDFVRSLDLWGVQFVDIRELSPTLDKGQLAEVRAQADRQGLYLEVGVSCVNPLHPDGGLLRDGDGDLAAGLRSQLERIAEVSIGSRTVRCFVGGPGDRVGGRVPWSDQVEEAVAIAKRVAPALRDLRLKLAIENHADFSTDELIEVVSRIGPDVAGICLDTANAFNAVENPLEAARRAAPYTVATHLKDAILTFGDQGLVVSPRAVGQGLMPVGEILQVLHGANPALAISIEDYGMLLPVPVFEGAYLSSFARVSPVELAWLVEQARTCELAIAQGALASPAAVERTPWSVRAKERLAESARFVNGVVDQLGFRS